MSISVFLSLCIYLSLSLSVSVSLLAFASPCLLFNKPDELHWVGQGFEKQSNDLMARLNQHAVGYLPLGEEPYENLCTLSDVSPLAAMISVASNIQMALPAHKGTKWRKCLSHFQAKIYPEALWLGTLFQTTFSFCVVCRAGYSSMIFLAFPGDQNSVPRNKFGGSQPTVTPVPVDQRLLLSPMSTRISTPHTHRCATFL